MTFSVNIYDELFSTFLSHLKRGQIKSGRSYPLENTVLYYYINLILLKGDTVSQISRVRGSDTRFVGGVCMFSLCCVHFLWSLWVLMAIQRCVMTVCALQWTEPHPGCNPRGSLVNKHLENVCIQKYVN